MATCGDFLMARDRSFRDGFTVPRLQARDDQRRRLTHNNLRAYSPQTTDVTRGQPDTSGRCPGVCQLGVHRDTAVERVTAQAGALAMGGHEVVALCHRPVDNEATKVVFRVSSQFLLGPRCGHRGSEVPSSGCLAW
jgi:hypothetical protein